MYEKIKKPSVKKYFDNVSVGKRTKQVVYFSQQHDKNAMFEQLTKESDSKQTVVLVKSKKNADSLSAYLKTKDIKAVSIHGNHRVAQIEDAAKAFNASELSVLITTDMILKSLELQNIQLIVNYDLPTQFEEYFVRLAYVDEVGESILLVNAEEESTLQIIEMKMKMEIEQGELEGFVDTQLDPKNIQTKKDKKKKPRHRKKKKKIDPSKEEETTQSE
ncbi:helicase-related protein [Sulfurimonas sp.]|uniref:helicase-related protein n=1 Tax=Sulfurimonas sp. TaxID=2022749 RepID=UPI0025DA6EBE|nr:helicase-related protein [Sulfurimonas sp.]